MSKYNDVLKEFKNRLTTATATGKNLADVKKVYIGSRQNVVGTADLPIIILDFESLGETNFAIMGGGGWVGELELSVTIYFNLNNELADNLYDDFIGLIERVGNTLYTNTSLNYDPALNNLLAKSFDLAGGKIEKITANQVCFTYTITAKTQKMTQTGR